MFTLKNHAGAGTLTHFEELLAAACYHHGRWFGMGFEILEIRGEITEVIARSLFANRHPITGRPLVVSRGKRQRKSLLRFTEVSVMLPWSVAALIGKKQDVVTSHGHAADAVLRYLEIFAAGKPRADNYSLFTITGNLVAVSFDSLIFSSGVTVPQTRYLIFNLTFDEEFEEWGELDTREMEEASARVADIYREQLCQPFWHQGKDVTRGILEAFYQEFLSDLN